MMMQWFLVVLLVSNLFTCADGTETVEGTIGWLTVHKITIVNRAAHWMDAVAYCRSEGLGDLLTSNKQGAKVASVRNTIHKDFPQLAGLSFWLDYIKMANDWFRLMSTCEPIDGSDFGFVEDNDGTSGCLAFNTTLNDNNTDGIRYETRCDLEMPFICLKDISERQMIARKNSTIQLDDGLVSKLFRYYNKSSSCKSTCAVFAGCFASVHDVVSLQCVLYQVVFPNWPLNITLVSKVNFVVFYKVNPDEVDLRRGVNLTKTVFDSTLLPCQTNTDDTTTTNQASSQAYVTNLQENETIGQTNTDDTTTTNQASSQAYVTNLQENETIALRLARLKEDNLVNQRELNSYKNKFISMPDKRMSSRVIGSTGVIIMSVMMSLVFLSDIPSFKLAFQDATRYTAPRHLKCLNKK